MPHIGDEEKECVGFLAIDDPTTRGRDKEVVGTAFFVNVWNRDHTNPTPYLVTAKHVWQDYFAGARQGYIRLNRASQSGVEYVPLQDGWFFHPDSAVDIAALPWSRGDLSLDYTITSLQLDKVIATPSFLKDKHIPWPPKEGEDTWLVGLMTQFYGEERNFPVVRRGHVALATQEPVEGIYGYSDYYFVETQIYPGNSGSPIWVSYNNTLFLLGILAAGHPVEQELLRRLDDKWRKVTYYNLGIALVVPAQKLVEVLESKGLDT